MRGKFSIFNQFSIPFLILAGLFLPAVYAQEICLTQSSKPRVEEGLISAFRISNFGNPEGRCVVGNKAAFVPYKIPDYNDLYSLYYTQSKVAKTDATPPSGTANQGNLRSAFNSYDVVWINGDININGAVGGTPKTVIVFVENNLNIDKDFTFGDNSNGVVFVVKSNVNIDKDVRQIDAVIISSGTICTAYDSTATPPSCPASDIESPQLTINGSLISLNESAPIKFKRSLANNTCDDCAAEKIINQPKYLVILRNLLSDTWQKWSEIQ